MNLPDVGRTFLSAGGGDLPIASPCPHTGLDSDARREQEVRYTGRLESLPYSVQGPDARLLVEVDALHEPPFSLCNLLLQLQQKVAAGFMSRKQVRGEQEALHEPERRRFQRFPVRVQSANLWLGAI